MTVIALPGDLRVPAFAPVVKRLPVVLAVAATDLPCSAKKIQPLRPHLELLVLAQRERAPAA